MRKQYITTLLLAALIATGASNCSISKKAAIQGYQTIPDSETKILVGHIPRRVLETDTAFAWFKNNMQFGSADAAAVQVFTARATQFSVIVYAGTWCHDSQYLLPVFFRLVDKSGYPLDKVKLVGVDRNKKAPDGSHERWNIINVPTFIILDNNGKEVGRVVEYGKYGVIDKELGEIVSRL
ncbi:MAG: TlpA family protein disulfide reductase [Chitinophagaceae bacterium]